MVISKPFVVLAILSMLLLVQADELVNEVNDQFDGKTSTYGYPRINCRAACRARCRRRLATRPSVCQSMCVNCCGRCGCVPQPRARNPCPCYFRAHTPRGKMCP